MDPFSNLFAPTHVTVHNERNNTRETLPPEPQNGNVEYKWKIIDPTEKRFEHLVSQMKWRLQEGNGEAFYQIGVDDKGSLRGLTEDDLEKTLDVLNRMAEKLKATTTILAKRSVPENRNIVEVRVNEAINNTENMEIRVAVSGNANAGKSTLLGVLTQGCLDNGRGKARLNMLRHLHEIQTGRTSSISHEILGFDCKGDPVNYGGNVLRTPKEICEESSKLVSFLDLAGHKKYLKTTIHGLSGYFPHYAMLIVPSNTGATYMTHEHLTITTALNVPFFFVVTKIDLVPPENTLAGLEDLLKEVGSRKTPFTVNSEEDIMLVSDFQVADEVVPIFCVSNVTGEGIRLLTKFLSLLVPTASLKEEQFLEEELPHFQIDEVFNSTDAGQLVAGILKRGVITESQTMRIGPFSSGAFLETKIESIHRNRVRVGLARAGHCVVLKLSVCQSDIRKGMVILSTSLTVHSCFLFKAHVTGLDHSAAVIAGLETSVYIGNIRQAASVVRVVGKDCIGANESGCVLFRFVSYPEYVTPGERVLFWSGLSKGVGEVTQVFPIDF